MARRKRNMLEAFQASKAEDSRESDPAPRAGSRAAGGPFAAGERQAERPLPAAARPPRERPEREPEESRREPDAGPARAAEPAAAGPSTTDADAPAPAAFGVPLTRRLVGPLVLSQVLLLALAFWAGRASVSDVAAAATAEGAETATPGADGLLVERPVTPTPAPDATPPAAPPAADGEPRPADERFHDAANRFTVVAIEYPNTAYWKDRVWQVQRHVERAGLPAVSPIARGGSLFLCVGAEPTMEGRLTELRDRVRALPGPDPATDPRPFGDAYFRNIDDLIRR